LSYQYAWGRPLMRLLKARLALEVEFFVCVIGGAKLLCVINVGSWCLSCQPLKNMLSHRIVCAMDYNLMLKALAR
jgi:hypothetical protein